MVSIGNLRERVTLQQPVVAPDGGGGGDKTWQNVDAGSGEIWADVEPLSGREITEGEREEHRARYKVTVRYRDDILAGWRLVWGSKVMNIRSALNDDQRRRFTEIYADEGAPS